MNVVSQLAAPLYDSGTLLPRVRQRRTHTVNQPDYPLYEGWGMNGPRWPGRVSFRRPHTVLGAAPEGPTILSATAPIASVATTAILTPVFTSGAAAGTGAAAGSWAGPIGAAVGVLIGVIAGLWAAHDARVQGATAENQAINSAVNTWDQGMKAIFNAANSSDPTVNVPGPTAAQQVQQLFATFWQRMSPYLHAPGVADASMGGTNCGDGTLLSPDPCAGTPGGHPCGKSCTATCCVGCADLYPSMLQALQVLNSPSGGQVKVCTVYGSHYGANQRSGYTLTYTPPAISPLASAAGSAATGITGAIESLFGGGATTGAATGTSSILPLLALGVAAYLVLR